MSGERSEAGQNTGTQENDNIKAGEKVTFMRTEERKEVTANIQVTFPPRQLLSHQISAVFLNWRCQTYKAAWKVYLDCKSKD